MAKPKGGLTAWFGKGPKGDWVDIGAPKKKGKFQSCGRASTKGSKRKYPKCVPRATARKMTKSQITSAVKRKRAKAQGCLLYTSPSPRDGLLSRMPSSA